MKPFEYALAVALLGLVAGCGGGGGGGDSSGPTPTPPPVGGTPPGATQFALGGTVSGLGQGTVVTLSNGSESIPVGANGSFTFATRLAPGAAFNVTATPPGGYSCKVTDGAGTMASADSTKTAVACAPVLLAGAITALQEPQGVTSDASGNLYVVDGGSHSIIKFAPNGVKTTLAGGTAKPGFAEGAGATARFRFYGGGDVVSDAQGNLFVSDECNGAIRKLAADGTVSTLAGQGSTFCNNVVPATGVTAPRDGVGADARFQRPNRMVSDGAGGVIVIDSVVPGSVRFVSAAGAVTTRNWATPAGVATVPTFYGLARGNDGTLYLSDFDGRIWRDANGTLALVAGDIRGLLGLPPADGVGASARFSAITDIVVAPDGNLYVGDFSMVRKVTPAGAVTTIAGSATRGFIDGQGAAARFTSIRAMGIDGNNLIVIDSDQGVLRRVSLAGAVSTVAATPALRGNVDGTGAAARFNWHTSLATDTAGNLYMADSAAHVIRKVAANGSATTLAGKAGTAGVADGALATATFNGPRAVAAGRDGSVWVAQSGAVADTGALRRIMDGTVTTVDPTLQVSSLAVDANGNAIVTAYLTAANGVTTYTVQRVTPAGARTVLIDAAKVAALIGVPSTRFVPQSVALDAAGNIYISDTGTVAVYKLTPEGVLSVFAGTPLKEGDADGAVGTATFGFYEVDYLTIDDKGNLYLSGQGSVRMISPAGVVSTPNFAWNKESIGAIAFANGRLYGMTRYALLQNYVQ